MIGMSPCSANLLACSSTARLVLRKYNDNTKYMAVFFQSSTFVYMFGFNLCAWLAILYDGARSRRLEMQLRIAAAPWTSPHIGEVQVVVIRLLQGYTIFAFLIYNIVGHLRSWNRPRSTWALYQKRVLLSTSWSTSAPRPRLTVTAWIFKVSVLLLATVVIEH